MGSDENSGWRRLPSWRVGGHALKPYLLNFRVKSEDVNI
jgi:hypothetical protein